MSPEEYELLKTNLEKSKLELERLQDELHRSENPLNNTCLFPINQQIQFFEDKLKNAHPFWLDNPSSIQDHQFLVELHNDPEVLKNITNPSPITFEEHMAWWLKIKDNPNEKRFILRYGQFGGAANGWSVPIGFTKFYSIDRNNHNCVLGADLAKAYRGKGHAKTMWKEMLKVAFDGMDMHRVSLTTAEYNHVAQNVYQKLGFKIEGTLKESLYRNCRYHDQICMYMTKQMWISNYELQK